MKIFIPSIILLLSELLANILFLLTSSDRLKESTFNIIYFSISLKNVVRSHLFHAVLENVYAIHLWCVHICVFLE